MLERQRAGIDRAKAEGKFQVRPRSFDPAAIRELRAKGLGATAIARKLGCERPTVYRARGLADPNVKCLAKRTPYRQTTDIRSEEARANTGFH